jgi:hypothetical protein
MPLMLKEGILNIYLALSVPKILLECNRLKTEKSKNTMKTRERQYQNFGRWETDG